MITNMKGQGHSFEPPRWAPSGLRLRVASETRRRARAQRRSTFCSVFSLFSFPFQSFSDFYAYFFFHLECERNEMYRSSVSGTCRKIDNKVDLDCRAEPLFLHIYIKEAKLQWLVGSEQDFSWTTQPWGWPLNQLSGLHILCDSECLGVPQEELQSFASLKHPAEPMLPADPLVHGRRLEFILVIINISNMTGPIILMLHLIFYFSPLFQTVGRERIHAAVLPRSPVLLHWIGAVAYDILRLYPTKKKINRTERK